MKIAIDIRRMTEFGVGTYTRNVVRALGRLDHESEYYLLGSPEKLAEIGFLPSNFQSVALHSAEGTVKNYFECRAAIHRLGCDLIHIPHLFWMPRNLRCPYVMTVHDVLEHLYRARGLSGLRRSMHFQLTRRVLSGAARIFAVSTFTKNEIQKLFGISSHQIEVIHNAIDERFLHGHASEADREFLAQRYQVTYPFLLYAGRISPHKNVVRI
ncbi:MAG TPA: glycosyltransferase, partial [Terriglobales bacterium]